MNLPSWSWGLICILHFFSLIYGGWGPIYIHGYPYHTKGENINTWQKMYTRKERLKQTCSHIISGSPSFSSLEFFKQAFSTFLQSQPTKLTDEASSGHCRQKGQGGPRTWDMQTLFQCLLVPEKPTLLYPCMMLTVSTSLPSLNPTFSPVEP